MNVAEIALRKKCAGTLEIGFALPGETSYNIRAQAQFRSEANSRVRDELRYSRHVVWPIHAPEDIIGTGLQGKVEKPADVRVPLHDVKDFRTAQPRFQRAEPDPMRDLIESAQTDFGKGVQDIVQPFSAILVQCQVASRDYYLSVARLNEGFRPGKDFPKWHGNRRTPEMRHNAVRAFSAATILDFQVGPARRHRHGRLRAVVLFGNADPSVCQKLWKEKRIWQASHSDDARCGEALPQPSDCLFTVVLRLCRHGAAAHNHEIWTRGVVLFWKRANSMPG